MKQFSCGQIVSGCPVRFTADTDEEILVAVEAHAREAHGMTSIPPEVISQVRSLITLTA